MTINERKIIAEDLRNVEPEICLLYISTCSFPLARLNILRMLTAKVLVLIPPPVDAGDAPIHINKIINKMVGK